MSVLTTRMNPVVKTKWVAELRSGRYGQAQGVLNDGNGNYCCLGVLCEVARQEGVELITLERANAEDLNGLDDEAFVGELTSRAITVADTTITPSLEGVTYIDANGDASTEVLPKAVIEWACLKEKNPDYRDDDGMNWGNLADLNDSGVTFDEIADVIEEYL